MHINENEVDGENLTHFEAHGLICGRDGQLDELPDSQIWKKSGQHQRVDTIFSSTSWLRIPVHPMTTKAGNLRQPQHRSARAALRTRDICCQ
jgi:hypothetical protein